MFSDRRESSAAGWERPLRIAVAVLVACVANATTRSVLAQVPGELRGHVTDAESRRAIAGARVEIATTAAYAISDVTGAFVLRGLEPGTFDVRVRALGHAPRDTTVSIANGRAATIDIVLQPVASRLETVVVRSDPDSAGGRGFDRRAIEQSGRRDLGELLQAIPGVVVTRAGGPGSPSHISIRGSAASEVLVLVDGIPLNSAISGDADLSTISLETVERIRVLPGAQSARYGPRALAGVVVIDTRRNERSASAAASMGAWGERNASVAIGRRVPWTPLVAAGSIVGDYRDVRGDFSYDVPDVRGGGTARRTNADARSVGVLVTGSITGAEDERRSLQGRAEWQSRTRGLPGSIVQPSTTGRQRDSRVVGGVEGRYDFSRIAWTANGDATRERAVFADPAPPFGTAYDETVNATGLTFATSATTGFSLGSFSVGADARRLEVSSTMLATSAPRRQNQRGTWVTLHVARSLANLSEFSADLSARADWDSFLDGAIVSPRAVMSASRGPAIISASFGAGYAPPSLADQFFHEGVLVRPNPELRPERVRDEVELRAALRDTRLWKLEIGGDAAVYRANIDGMILWVPDFRFIWSPSNFDVRRSGWEISGRIAAPSVGATLRASAGRADVSYAGPVLSGQVAYRPRSTASVAAGISRWATRAELTTRYIGARRTVAGSELNLLDAYTLSDFTLARTLPVGAWLTDVSVGVENVFNRPASMLVDYPFPGRAWTVALRTRRR